MRLVRLILLLTFFCAMFSGCARETTAEHSANQYAAQELAAAPLHSNIPDYSLSPSDLEKSQHLSKVGVTMHFVQEAWDLIALILLLSLGVMAWMRDKAAGISKNVWGQGYIFLLLYLIVDWLVDLPLDLYRQHLSLVYGLSVQSWGSWFGDEAKGLGMGWGFGGLIFLLLFWVIRKFPRRWWLVFWGCSIPIGFFILFVSPYIEPAFNKYEPLQQSNPELVAQLEKVVQKNHMDIPPSRMFLMKASEKVTTMNADVEGFGASKRVVVWDNTIAKMKPEEILLVFGHESGHYVLHHIQTTVTLVYALLFVLLFLAYHFVQWAIARFGAQWRVPEQGDWAAFGVLLLAFSIGTLFTEPILNNFSRMNEHAADVFGQEAVHGLVADPQAAAQGAFVALGRIGFSDPNPNPLYEFWTYSHPGVGRRAAFAKVYDPWAPGMEPKYFKK